MISGSLWNYYRDEIKTIFWSVKNKQEAYGYLFEISRNNGYTTGNLLDYLNHENYYTLIGVDLSIKTNTGIPQQINFTEKLERNDGTTMLFVCEKQRKTILKFYFYPLIETE